MSLKATGVLTSLLLSGVAPAWAVSVTPGTLTPSSNSGLIDVVAAHRLSSVYGTVDSSEGQQFYWAPVDTSGSESSDGPLGTAKTSAALKIDNSPTPSVSTTAQIALKNDAGARWSVDARSNYSFQILGAPGQAQVAIVASGSAGFSGDAKGAQIESAIAFLRIQQQFNGPLIVDIRKSMENGSVLGGDGVIRYGFIDAENPNFLAPNSFPQLFSVRKRHALHQHRLRRDHGRHGRRTSRDF